MAAEVALRLLPNAETDFRMPDVLVGKAEKPSNPLLSEGNDYSIIGHAGPLVAEPRAVHCNGIQPGLPVTRRLRLLNTSAKPLRLHIHPPSTPFFHLKVEKRGRVMPGMADELLVTFTATDMRHYHDHIRVHSEAGNLSVPLHAYPSLEELRLPQRIDFGSVALGSTAQRELPLRAPPGVEFEFLLEEMDSTALPGELTISHMSGLIPAGGQTSVGISYSPLRLTCVRLSLRLLVSQPDWQPITFEVVGSCAPGMNKQRHLHSLGASLSARAASAEAKAGGRGGGGARGGQTALRVEEVGVDGFEESAPPLFPAEGGGQSPREGSQMSQMDGLTPPERAEDGVLSAPPNSAMERAAASTYGGGAGRGDATSRAMQEERRQRVGRRQVPVRLPQLQSIQQRNAPEPTVIDGLRIGERIESQRDVNKLLIQRAGKVPVAELRSVIQEQQAKTLEESTAADTAMAKSLSPVQQLEIALAQRLPTVLEILESWDADGSGTVERGEFVKALPHFGVQEATIEDMYELFDQYDQDRSGTIEYAELKHVLRKAVVSARERISSGPVAGPGAAPGQLDIALQGPERSLQIKEILFTREVLEIERFEKEKEVKSILARGQPLLPEEHAERVDEARLAFYANVEQQRKERALRRDATEQPPKERALITEEAQEAAAATTPVFDPYSNDSFSVREQALQLFQLAVRTVVTRQRVATRLEKLQASLQRSGVSLSNRSAVRQLVLARVRAGHQPPPEAGGGAQQQAAKGGVSFNLESVQPFSFPSGLRASEVSAAAPVELTPPPPFDEIKCMALRVPRRYLQMGYEPLPLTAPGSFPKPHARALRTGAAFESGAPLPSGEPHRYPGAPLPPALLQPPCADDMDAALEVPPAPVEDTEAAAQSEADPSWLSERRGVRAVCQPPPFNETSAEQQLRAQLLPANKTWLRERTGLCSARTLLAERTLSSRWRRARQPWAEALQPLPRALQAPLECDTAAELSEDESDTEIESTPATDARLGEIFLLPAVSLVQPPAPAAAEPDVEGAEAGGAAGDAAGETAEELPEWRQRLEAAQLAAEAAPVAAELQQPVDSGSHRARAESALQRELETERRQRRLRLGLELAQMNEHIHAPRYQLKSHL